jgi:hypothetical protein
MLLSVSIFAQQEIEEFCDNTLPKHSYARVDVQMVNTFSQFNLQEDGEYVFSDEWEMETSMILYQRMDDPELFVIKHLQTESNAAWCFICVLNENNTSEDLEFVCADYGGGISLISYDKDGKHVEMKMDHNEITDTFSSIIIVR